jgi:hypothetical protein
MQLRGSAPDAAAFDEKVLAALEAWRASDGWNVDKRDWPIPPEQCSHFVSSGE